MLGAAVWLALATPGAEAAARAALDRIRQRDGAVHAILALDPTALAQARHLDRSRSARGPLFGMPVLLKDNIEARGPLPTTAGSLALLKNVSRRDASVVARLRSAGAVILGKTNLSEWANMRSTHAISGWSAVGGQTRNPHALGYTPCGSSSGSAAAVAEGLVDAAIGTETDGSITCPASINGVVGMKPTLGLVSRSGIIPISHAQDTAGPIGRDVRTVARLLTAMGGSDAADPATANADAHKRDYAAALNPRALAGVRVGVVRLRGWSLAVEALFTNALAKLREAGAILVELPAPANRGEIGKLEGQALACEFKTDLNDYLAAMPRKVRSRTLHDLIAFNKAHPAGELTLFRQDVFENSEATGGARSPACSAARRRARQLAGAEGLDTMLVSHQLSALVAPTIAPAWRIDTPGGDPDVISGIGSLAAVAGCPHLSVPMGKADGLPVGLSFIGAAWNDEVILRLGYAYERATVAH